MREENEKLCNAHGMFYEYNGVIVWPVCIMAINHQGRHSDEYDYRWVEQIPVQASQQNDD